MSTNLVEIGAVKLTRYYGEKSMMYQLTVGGSYVEKSREEMEDLLIELLTEVTNEKI